MEDLLCPYCGKIPLLVDSKEVYHGRSYGMIWLCRDCDAYVGCHSNSKDNKPKGTLANKELRDWRIKAHTVFDPLWKKKMEQDKSLTRNHAMGKAQKWLCAELGIEFADCHIAMFDIEKCRKTEEICKSVLNGTYAKNLTE